MSDGRVIDLHLHTLHSDGTFSSTEVVERAKAAGLAAISIADHDTIAALPEARQAAGLGIEFISGVELTVRFRDRELHILGYGFRESDEGLHQFLAGKQAERQDRMQGMLDRLAERDIVIQLSEVQEIAGAGEALGRPHLAEVMLTKGVVRSMPEAFDQYIGDNAPCFVKKATLEVSQAVELIRKYGGVAVLAHPYNLVQDGWFGELLTAGIQGIEVYHPDHNASARRHYRELAEAHNLLITGGSDCHGFRHPGGPAVGTVKVPYSCLVRLKEALS